MLSGTPRSLPPAPPCILPAARSFGEIGRPPGVATPGGRTGGIVSPLVRSVGELDPPVLRVRPEQMKGSKSRMQGKVTTEDAMPEVYVGIDVCKEHLDVYLHPLGEEFSVANDAGG